MLKLLILAALAVWLWRRWGAVPVQHGRHGPATRSSRPVDMVRCGHCGTHVPRDEACGGPGVWYCCPEHERESRRHGA